MNAEQLQEMRADLAPLVVNDTNHWLRGRRHGERGHLATADELRSTAYLRGLRSGYSRRADRLYDLASGAFARATGAIADGKPTTRHWRRYERLSAQAQRFDGLSGRRH